MFKTYISLVIATMFLCGCSTIVKGKYQVVTIESNVKDAEITLNGKIVGRTPFTGPIERGSNNTLTLKKDGYDSRSITMDTSFEPIFWGNIIIGGFLGSTTDAASGAMYKYAPATFNIDLTKTTGN